MVQLARELIDRLQREDGTVRIESPDDETRARHRRIIHAAKQHALVPTGYHLRHTGRDAGDIVIRLSQDSEPDNTAWNQIRLNTRRVTTDLALVFAALDADPTNLNVTAESLPRALQLIRLLAAEARKREHRVGVNTKTKHPRVYLQIGQARRAVTLIEEYDKVRHVPTAQELRDLRRHPWRTPPEFDSVASGRLRLEIFRDGYNKRDAWTDAKRSPLERRLRQVIRDVEAGAAADEQARLAYQRAQEEAAAERKRQEEATLAQWRAAMADARTRAVDKLRADTFRHSYQAWTAAAEIRAFCTALEQAAANGDLDSTENISRWVAWGRAAADQIDPACGTPSLAEVNYDVEPGPDDLRPFLGEWSPHRPQREYRYERDEQALADARRQAESWHRGMLGQRAWR